LLYKGLKEKKSFRVLPQVYRYEYARYGWDLFRAALIFEESLNGFPRDGLCRLFRIRPLSGTDCNQFIYAGIFLWATVPELEEAQEFMRFPRFS